MAGAVWFRFRHLEPVDHVLLAGVARAVARGIPDLLAGGCAEQGRGARNGNRNRKERSGAER